MTELFLFAAGHDLLAYRKKMVKLIDGPKGAKLSHVDPYRCVEGAGEHPMISVDSQDIHIRRQPSQSTVS